MIPGYRTIRVQVPDAVHEVGERLKGAMTWDELVAAMITERVDIEDRLSQVIDALAKAQKKGDDNTIRATIDFLAGAAIGIRERLRGKQWRPGLGGGKEVAP